MGLKFISTTSGVKAHQRETANVLINSAKYAETCMKILLTIQKEAQDPEYSVNDQLNNLYTCVSAQLNYLQEDYGNLIVGSRFGQRTQQIYRDLQRNTSVFPPTSLRVLRSAISFASAQDREESRGFQSRAGSRFQRGHFRGRGHGRGWFNQGDQNPGFIPRSVPSDQQDSQS